MNEQIKAEAVTLLLQDKVSSGIFRLNPTWISFYYICIANCIDDLFIRIINYSTPYCISICKARFATRFILPFLLMIFVLSGYAQNIPDAVKQTFHARFPDATMISWQTNEGIYKALFTNASRNMSVSFKENGKLSETKTWLIANDLPYDITNFVEAK